MTQLRLIAGAALTERVRWAREHVYALAVLAPVVLGMTYFGVGRLVREAEWALSPAWAVALATLAACAVVVISMSRASAELYHVRRPESFFESLPVETDTHFYAALAGRLARGLPLCAAALVARTLAGGRGWDALLIPSLAFLLMGSTLAEVTAALHWIHWGHTRERATAAGALMLLLPGVVLCGLLVVGIVTPEKLPASWRVISPALAPAWSALALALARRNHARWRRADIEHARRLGAPGRRRSLFGSALLSRRLGAPVAALLARDLQLTLRRFSSAVYVAAGVAALFVVVLFAVLVTGALPEAAGGSGGESVAGSWLDATWLPPVVAVKAACVLSTVALASLAAVLVAHELSRFWVERAAGALGADVARAKLWYARVVSLPAPAAVFAAGALSGEVPAFYLAPLLLECLLLWFIVSTLVGVFAFEMPEQPGLALILMACVGVAAGLLVAWVWPVGIFVMFSVPSLYVRGAMRARYYLIEGAD